MKKFKSFKKIEGVIRGFSNHRRIQILDLLKRKPELSVIDITEDLKINYKTASDHVRRLSYAGLIMKRNDLNEVKHRLTTKGEIVLKFCRTLE